MGSGYLQLDTRCAASFLSHGYLPGSISRGVGVNPKSHTSPTSITSSLDDGTVTCDQGREAQKGNKEGRVYRRHIGLTETSRKRGSRPAAYAMNVLLGKEVND